MKNLTLALLVLFLVAFPKAGFKLAQVPITFGYILLGIVGMWALYRNIAACSYRYVPWRGAIAFASTLPLQVIALLLIFGLRSDDIGLSLSFIVSFCFLPTAFLVLLTPQISQVDLERLELYVRRCVTFVALYGIFLFVYRIRTGSFLEIPFLTVNVDDVGTLTSKDINRGNGVFKLISTYNNGNIYGVCILMLLPLYDLVQRRAFWRIIVRLSLLLTLSRTVWFGWIVYEALAALYLRRVRWTTMLYVVAAIGVAVGSVLYVLHTLDLDVMYLFAPDLGGRAEVLQQTRFRFIPYDFVTFPSEIIYVNVLNAFGVAGLTCFLLAVGIPLVLAAAKASHRGTRSRAFVLGMAMLLICGVSDGPILLIPVMAFYWALAAFALCGADASELGETAAASWDGETAMPRLGGG